MKKREADLELRSPHRSEGVLSHNAANLQLKAGLLPLLTGFSFSPCNIQKAFPHNVIKSYTVYLYGQIQTMSHNITQFSSRSVCKHVQADLELLCSLMVESCP